MATATKKATTKKAATKPAAAGRKPAAKKSAGSAAPPWDKDNPKDASGEPHQHLTPQQKASAKRAANKAGRPYPNLVDNLHEMQKAKKEEKS